jgi:plasmid replication initiation protein
MVKLKPLSEEGGLSRFLRNEDHAALLSGFVQDIANAVMDYLVCGRKRTLYVTNNRLDLSPAKHVREYQGNQSNKPGGYTRGIAENAVDIVVRRERSW